MGYCKFLPKGADVKRQKRKCKQGRGVFTKLELAMFSRMGKVNATKRKYWKVYRVPGSERVKTDSKYD